MQIHSAALDLHVDTEAEGCISATFSHAQTRQGLLEISVNHSECLQSARFVIRKTYEV